MTTPVTDTHGPDLTSTIPQCDAFLAERRVRASGWGLELVQCRVTRGLSAFRDHQGQTRRACGASGHSANVTRRFGVMENEPDWLATDEPVVAVPGWFTDATGSGDR